MQRALDFRRFLVPFLVLAIAFAWIGSRSPVQPAAPALQVPEVSVELADAMVKSGALLIDVRAGVGTHIPGALLIPLEELARRIGEIEHAKSGPIVVYCGNGSTRGPEAVQMLRQSGFTGAVNIAAGFSGWKDSGRPVTKG